ncbi:MAG: DISARM system SNF2-like helicase DrmD [Chloroflexi bacterium]|nr:DISARM system SNF2-like helicase DrmD [Chloroflexota bacterium]
MVEQRTILQGVPERGQITRIRQRHYVVTDVARANLPADGIHNGLAKPQHIVGLSSIDDDGLGETLEIIWEIEPGKHLLERLELPVVRELDPPEHLDAFIDAVRWGAVSQADTRVLQAPFRSGIDIEDYQLDPLARAIQMPRVNLLIADDVGLGKTVEAGLVIQELIVRNRARKILIVCPAGLQIHWRDQMQEKFGLDFRIVDSDLIKDLRRNRGIRTNPWTHFPRLITSIDYIKGERSKRFLRDALPAEGESRYPRKFDVLIVDEAHNIAPASGGRHATESLRAQVIKTLAPHFEHKLFLSATPHNGYQESFTALLALLDNQRFARGVLPDETQRRTVMVRRLKSEITLWNGQPKFPPREIHVIEVDYTDDERAVHRALTRYARLRTEAARDGTERYATEFVLKLLKKRLFSSPQAFLDTLDKHKRTISESTRSHGQTHRKPPQNILRRQLQQIDESYADDDEYEGATDSAVDTATRTFRPLNNQEQALIDQMRSWAERAAARQDQKTCTLVQWLRRTLKPHGHWNDERVIIFTEYRSTQKWLQEILAHENLGGEQLMAFYGGMDKDERERVKAAFQADPAQSPVRILLATDAASEGIDLQNHCHRLIHIEIPWNPNRLEQRNGRIDRHGQRKNPLIFHFVAKEYEERAQLARDGDVDALDADLEFLMRAVQKIEQIRADLGSVSRVFANQVEEAMLGQRRQLDTSTAEEQYARINRMLRFERDLQRQIEQHHEQLKESRDQLNLSPENIQAVTEIALGLARQPALRPHTAIAGAYIVPPLTDSWRQASRGLEHPYTQKRRPIVFDHDLARELGDDVVLAHLNHPLVQMSLRLLRAEVWSAGANTRLNRVTAREVANHVLPGNAPAVIAHARLVVIGGDYQRLHEEIITAGGILGPRFSRLNVGQVERALSAQTDTLIIEREKWRLIEFYNQNDIEDHLRRALKNREDDYRNRMRRLLDEHANKEQRDIESILKELARAIEAELDVPDVQQLDLPGFNEEDRSIHKNALIARLQEIPEEIEREKEAIHNRFAEPQTRLFPVAITFLVPQRLNR